MSLTDIAFVFRRPVTLRIRAAVDNAVCASFQTCRRAVSSRYMAWLIEHCAFAKSTSAKMKPSRAQAFWVSFATSSAVA